MASREQGSKKGLKRMFAAVVAILLVLVGYTVLRDEVFNGDFAFSKLDYDEAVDRLGGMVQDIDWRESRPGQVTAVEVQQVSLEDSLPPINTFSVPVAPVDAGAVVAEVFASTEKSGSGPDGWMVEVAEAFNAADPRLADGRRARIRIRKIASGTGYQFIASNKYRPDAFSPSNHLWIRMAEARGVPMTAIRERTVANVAGIVMKEEKADEFRGSGAQLNVPDLIDAVVQGKLVTGYTNPYASSTGLNFLVTVLSTFAGGDEMKMLSPAVSSTFEEFQRNIPFVAMTTLQMRDSVRRDGSLDAFVMEWQTYAKTSELVDDYAFIPFGQPHDNPLYGVGKLSPAKLETLELFATFMEQDRWQDLARDYEFNPQVTHSAPFPLPDGQTLIDAQRVWKEKKDAGRPVIAVFLSDVSGSMEGQRLYQLKQALIEGSTFISTNNSIGLVTFSDRVNVVLPVKPFSLLHKAAFVSAVKRLGAGGHTAMYDGIAVALAQLVEAKRDNPDAKAMLFVLTDGETNQGLEYADVRAVVEGLGVPVHTIGFEANLDDLGRISNLVEAASFNANTDDLRYQIGSMLNSQM